MRAVRQQMLLDALAGQDQGLKNLLLRGLRVVDGLRRSAGVQSAIQHAPKRSRTVRIALKYGASAQIPLEVPRKGASLVVVVNKAGSVQASPDPIVAVRWLLDRIKNDVELAVRVSLGIERARKQALKLFEQSTRWI